MEWKKLFFIGSSRIVRSTYIWMFVLPAIAKATIQLNELLNAVNDKDWLFKHLSLPFSWQVMFYASIFFGLGTFLYDLYCPSLVKNYKSYREFEEENTGVYKLNLEFEKYILAIKKKEFQREVLKDLVSKFFDRKSQIYINNKGDLSESSIDHYLRKINISVRKKADLYTYLYNALNFEKETVRFAITIIYTLGFLLLGVVLYQNIHTVWKLSNWPSS